jgi:threonine synthase
VRQLRASGWLSETDEVVVLNTGTGLIYPETITVQATLLPLSGPTPS